MREPRVEPRWWPGCRAGNERLPIVAGNDLLRQPPDPPASAFPTGYNVAGCRRVRRISEIFHGLVVVMVSPAAGRDPPHRVFDRDSAGLLEDERPLDGLSLLQGFLHVHEHDVEPAGLELDGLARLDLEPGIERAHAHQVALHGHLVDLE